jgi:hypothetical protein
MERGGSTKRFKSEGTNMKGNGQPSIDETDGRGGEEHREELTEERIRKEETETRKKKAKLTGRIGVVLNLMDGDMMKAVL